MYPAQGCTHARALGVAAAAGDGGGGRADAHACTRAAAGVWGWGGVGAGAGSIAEFEALLIAMTFVPRIIGLFATTAVSMTAFESLPHRLLPAGLDLI